MSRRYDTTSEGDSWKEVDANTESCSRCQENVSCFAARDMSGDEIPCLIFDRYIDEV